MFRVYAALIVIKAYSSASPRSCDSNVNTATKEGNVGETATFPWLGVLRVHIHQGDVFKVALTGLVLVKEGYAIANADDVARIPKRIFKEDSKAMFIPQDGEPWFCGLLDYMTHPEYEYSTMNTIALIELDPGEQRYFPMKPICWPSYSYNTSNELYAVGFTDDNQLLEKSIYSLQHVERDLCQEFYNRAGLIENKLTPTHYICGFAKHNQENCVWDNGIVMASNSTKTWTLIGFSIRGPGCAAPARFIDMLPFLPWIDSATNFEGVPEVDYRKSAFNEGFKKRLRAGESQQSGETPDLTYMIQNQYPFDTEFIQNEYFTVDRIDAGAINIRNISLPAEDGNCSSSDNELIYHDETKVVVEEKGFLSYRVSMYDLHYLNYSCVKIWIKPATCDDKATLYYAVRIDNSEGTSFKEFGTTPERILQTYPIYPVTVRPAKGVTVNPNDWKPGPHLKVAFLEDDTPRINIENYNIYLKFAFSNEGIINIEILGPLKPKNRTSTTSTTPETLRLGKEFEGEFVENGILGGEPNKTEPSGTEDLEPMPLVIEPTRSPELAKSPLVSAVQRAGTSLIDVIAIAVLVVWFLYFV